MIRGKAIRLRTMRETDLDHLYNLLFASSSRPPYRIIGKR
jgi:hypothetical protein